MIAVGAGGAGLLSASIGAVAALLLVVAFAIVVHKPLSVGEGIGLSWSGEDWSSLGLTLGFLVFVLRRAAVS